MAGTSWSQGTSSIIEGELIVLLEVMNGMEHRGITHVIFETDLQSVCHNLRDGNTKFNSIIICNIKNVLSVNYNFVVKIINDKRIWLEED
jgi:hypothetical protein